jgi:hypothetical protein
METSQGGSDSQTGIAARWREAMRSRAFRIELVGIVAALAAALAGFARFLAYNEMRSGVQLPDPVLALFPARDLTWLIFAMIYVSLFAAIYFLAAHPRELVTAMAAYAIMATIRVTAMYVTPLTPPPGLIPLVDPIIEYFGTGATVNRDLFFSGHTATLFLLFLTANIRWLRALFLTCTIVVAVCVLLQHVHYTVDVLVAPLASYVSWRIARAVLA